MGVYKIWPRKPPLRRHPLPNPLFLLTPNRKAPETPRGTLHGTPLFPGMLSGTLSLAHRNRSDFCDLRLRCPSRAPEIARFPRQEKAMLHCDLRVRWKVASDLRFRAAIPESKTPSFCGISGDLAPSTRKSLAIAIVRFWCANALGDTHLDTSGPKGPRDSCSWSARSQVCHPECQGRRLIPRSVNMPPPLGNPLFLLWETPPPLYPLSSPLKT